MLSTRLMIGALHGTFDVAEYGVEPLEFAQFHTAVSAGDHRLALEAGAGETARAGEPVAEDGGNGVYVALGEVLSLCFAEAGHLAQAQRDRVAVLVAGQGGEEGHLAR